MVERLKPKTIAVAGTDDEGDLACGAHCEIRASPLNPYDQKQVHFSTNAIKEQIVFG